MDLNNIYRAILKAFGLVAGDDGYVSSNDGTELKPFMVKGKRLVLATPEHQRNPDKSSIVLFHPLCENTLRGESDVLEALRTAGNARLQYVFAWVAYQLMTINTSEEVHQLLTPDQHEFLSKVRNADGDTLKLLEKIMRAMPVGQAAKCFVSIYLKRSGQVAGVKYARVGVVNFPLYKEMTSPESIAAKEVFGVKVPKKGDRAAIVALMEYMIPGIEKPHSYDRGSSDQTAPNMDALMKAFMAVASPLNDVIELFRERLDKPDELLFDSSWVEAFRDLGALEPLIRQTPMQAGNEGATNKAVPDQPVVAAAPQYVPTAPAPVAPVPVPAYPGQPAFMQQQAGQQMYQPVQQQVYQPPAPIRTANGVDWKSLIAASPALSATVGMGMQYPNQQMPMGGGRAGFGTPVQQQQPFYQQQQPMYQQYQQQPMGRSY